MADSHDLFMDCIEKTDQVSKYWRELGLRLKVKMYRLDEIESNHTKDVARCRMDMLSTWLRSNPTDPKAELDAALEKLKHSMHGEEILQHANWNEC